jgi:hypothetical protein
MRRSDWIQVNGPNPLGSTVNHVVGIEVLRYIRREERMVTISLGICREAVTPGDNSDCVSALKVT